MALGGSITDSPSVATPQAHLGTQYARSVKNTAVEQDEEVPMTTNNRLMLLAH